MRNMVGAKARTCNNLDESMNSADTVSRTHTLSLACAQMMRSQCIASVLFWSVCLFVFLICVDLESHPMRHTHFINVITLMLLFCCAYLSLSVCRLLAYLACLSAAFFLCVIQCIQFMFTACSDFFLSSYFLVQWHFPLFWNTFAFFYDSLKFVLFVEKKRASSLSPIYGGLRIFALCTRCHFISPESEKNVINKFCTSFRHFQLLIPISMHQN